MNVLLDTATFSWIARSPSKLSPLAATIYRDPMNEIFFSAISAYEIVVKGKLGKLNLDRESKVFVSTERGKRGIAPLPVDEADAFAVALLPAIHADPFDRILIAQCITGGLTLLTPDATIARYPLRVAW